MIRKQIAKALRERDWVAVAIEFMIVVVGIFVALQVEKWSQSRSDRELEQVYIARLIEETSANLALLRRQEKIYANKVEFILALPSAPVVDEVQRDPRAFIARLDASGYMQMPQMRTETLRELEGSGRLSLLRDTEMRSAVASALAEYASVREVMVDPIGEYRRILYETLPGRTYHEFTTEAPITKVEEVAASVEAFRHDPRFGAAANAEAAYGADMLFWVRDAVRRFEGILAMLERNRTPG